LERRVREAKIMLTVGLSVLALSGAVAPEPVRAQTHPDAGAPAEASRAADRAARAAAKAMKRGRTASAVMLAEQAVTLAPRDAAYRAALGNHYLRAGRFASARAMLAEALSLRPADGVTARNLALMQAAGGDDAAARATLEAHAGEIPASDLGLALALAGAPEAGAHMLIDAARRPGATPVVRQNLALALALAGDWQMARTVAAADLSPAALDGRMQNWAAMATERDPAARIARLLDVTLAVDPGRPVAIALLVPPPAVAAVPVPAEVAQVAPAAALVRFGPRREVVQPLSSLSGGGLASTGQAPRGGRWAVQIGAFDRPEVAREGWRRAQQRFPGFAGARPVTSVRRSLHRVAVAGYDLATATETCRRYRDKGGECFVRTFSGDRLAAWLERGAGGITVAAR
jgi:Flp pilus assembly protein TadD